MDKIDLSNFAIDDNFNDYIEKLLNDLRNDPPVYEIIKKMGVTTKCVKENISKFSDFQDDFNYCKNCPGIDKCNKKTPYLTMSLSYENGFVERNYSPCKKMVERIERSKSYLYADFPNEWDGLTFNTIDRTPMRDRAIILFNDIIDNKQQKWIYVYGKHATGKSFFVTALANEFVYLRKEQVAYINVNKRFKELADKAFDEKNRFEKTIINLSVVPLLIMDDFGSEYKSELVRDQILIPILLERSRNKRPIIFTSQFKLDEIRELYAGKNKASALRARQLYDLINEQSAFFSFDSAVSIYK